MLSGLLFSPHQWNLIKRGELGLYSNEVKRVCEYDTLYNFANTTEQRYERVIIDNGLLTVLMDR